MTPVDLSYIHETPSDAQEQAIKDAVEGACFIAIIAYLESLAKNMEDNKIEAVNVPTLRALAAELQTMVAQ
jgi:hypothetical protein